MIRKIAIIIIFICAPILKIGAQINLVKNPGLEQYIKCPNDWNEIKYANYWSSLGDTISAYIDSLGIIWCTPEYCNVCATDPTIGVPWGGGYYHYPHGGNGMASVQMFDNRGILDTGNSNASAYREYLQGRLFSHLMAGTTYCVNFYVVLTHLSAFSINKIGAYFDDGTIDTATWCGWPQTTHIPQVYETAIISDTLYWTKVEGSFTANGTETFITIGNFFDSANTDKIPTNFDWAIGADNYEYSWYLVDDISVIAANAVANAGPDRVTTPVGDSVWVGDSTGYLPCYWYKNGVLIDSNIAGIKVHPLVTTRYSMQLDVCGHVTTDTMVVWVYPVGVRGAVVLESEIVIYPNPATNVLTIEGADGCEVALYDILGRTVLNQLGQKHLTLDISSLSNGIYTIEVRDIETGMKVIRKIIKE